MTHAEHEPVARGGESGGSKRYLLSEIEYLLTEREKLRAIARDALRFREEVNGRCGHDGAMTKLCTQCEIRAALNEQKRG